MNSTRGCSPGGCRVSPIRDRCGWPAVSAPSRAWSATARKSIASGFRVDDALARIEALYKPYHRALRRLINKAHQAFGTVILVDCHSMPSIGVSRDEPRRPDVVIGDRYGTSCAPAVRDMVEETMSALGYSVGRNKPYAGGFITEHYGNPASGLHTIQLELNRAIYMDERRRERGPRFAQVAADFATWPTRWPPFRWRPRTVPGGGGVRSSVIPGCALRDPELNSEVMVHARNDGSRIGNASRKKGRLNEQAAQV